MSSLSCMFVMHLDSNLENQCHNDFVIRHKVLKHRSIATMPEKFTCDICSKKFTRKDNMRYHILEVHGRKKRECKYCNKKMRSSSIKRHIKYACIVRQKILKSKKKQKKQRENSPQQEKSSQIDRLNEEIFISSNDPFIASNEPFNILLNDDFISDETQVELSEFLIFN